MTRWQDRRILELFGIELPIIQAPMAGATTVAMVAAASNAGGLGSLPSAQYGVEQLRAALRQVRDATSKPINVNFFCHATPDDNEAAQTRWRTMLAPYFIELGLDPSAPVSGAGRAPFDNMFCEVVEEFRPNVVSFHFGLPEPSLVGRVKATGAKIVSSATTVEEAVWLETHEVDAVIAMGVEAGGHRGNFLTNDMSTQVGTMALVPQVVDAVRVPVIAAGGISDGRGVAAALMLGASAVQVGTAYLYCPEAKIPAVHAAALNRATDDNTAITNVFTGRPARGVLNRIMRELGPLSKSVPPFPTAGAALAALRAKAEASGRDDFTNLWSGQAARLVERLPAAELTQRLFDYAMVVIVTRSASPEV
ncbi:NAD(P)H-dependent flavin oxidoreductase [Rhizobium leguminosarum]|uniref:NAD(P)H-dependent flavin oxidoreductase n=1 Tax=Rhizobium leguminosarum TaxID=384 RepID=UPI001C918006|nr:nitronate monooxygenase family protein [Rhizobium leguminosarum]MBY2918787.1 nitronate monooxygenase [Rhizobium leguminosarum]MBY2974435.1 nitronate monooxygenase [Rhizobium leguminosarum]MBY2981917.1 nitronate monooxygenase [Rhizobium leguminosarum]MBY3010384.1 nitronate monooxygenase [Rhizobium leguminosarum]